MKIKAHLQAIRFLAACLGAIIMVTAFGMILYDTICLLWRMAPHDAAMALPLFLIIGTIYLCVYVEMVNRDV